MERPPSAGAALHTIREAGRRRRSGPLPLSGSESGGKPRSYSRSRRLTPEGPDVSFARPETCPEACGVLLHHALIHARVNRRSITRHPTGVRPAAAFRPSPLQRTRANRRVHPLRSGLAREPPRRPDRSRRICRKARGEECRVDSGLWKRPAHDFSRHGATDGGRWREHARPRPVEGGPWRTSATRLVRTGSSPSSRCPAGQRDSGDRRGVSRPEMDCSRPTSVLGSGRPMAGTPRRRVSIDRGWPAV
jgi:hypothetical protein